VKDLSPPPKAAPATARYVVQDAGRWTKPAYKLESLPISTLGHNPPVRVTFQFLLVVRPVIELSGRYSAGKLMTPLAQPGQERPLSFSKHLTAHCRVAADDIGHCGQREK
jgi:hypothetical protein